MQGYLRWDDAKHYPSTTTKSLARFELSPGDVVIALDRPITKAGLKCCVVLESDVPSLLVQRVARLRGTEKLDQSYLAQITQTDAFIAHLLGNKTETAVPHISPNDLRSFQFFAPKTIAEQSRIAERLKTWDKFIATTEALLGNSRRQKQDLMQVLLSGRRRFPGDRSTWTTCDFDHVFERIKRKNAVGNNNVLTISGQHGLISQRDYFNKSVASENLQGYTLLERGDFAYNKSYSAGYPLGAIKPLLAYDAGVVSSLYLCFRIKPGVAADADFFRHYFEAGMLNEEISGIAQEGARNHGLLNVSVTDFFKLRLHVPPVETQRRIAEVLNAAEAEERSFSAQLARLREEKRALMVDLLTGKRRVKLPSTDTVATPP